MKVLTNNCKSLSFFMLILFTQLFINFACETVVDVELPKHEPVIVVNSFFNPDSVWKLNLTRSQDALENESFQNIADATVEIFESGKIITELKHTDNGIYSANNSKPQSGKTYELRVTAPGFADVTSSDVVPQRIEISDVKVDTVINSDNMNELMLSIVFTDPPEKGNKYHIALWTKNSYYSKNGMEAIYFSSNDLLVAENDFGENGEFFGNEVVFDDVLLAGKQYELKLFVPGFDYWDDFYTMDELVVVLSSVSNAYFKYHTSFEKHEYSGDNPFSEPSIVYNNIKNGFGIFAGYNSYYYTVFN